MRKATSRLTCGLREEGVGMATMRRTLFHSGLVVTCLGLFGLTLTSCKGASEDDPDNGTRDPEGNSVPEQWPDETAEVREALAPLLEAACGWQFDCCTEGQREFTISGTSEDLDDCVDRLYEVARTGTYFNEPGPLSWLPRFFVYLGYGLDLDRVSIDEDALSECLEKLDERECNPAPNEGNHCVPVSPTRYSECETRAILKGKQKLGQPCSSVGGGVECEDDLICSLHGEQGVCIEDPTEGAPCIEDYQCRDGFVCDYRSNTCQEGGDEGDDCSFFDPEYPEIGSEAKRCAEGFLCDPRTETCEPETCTYGTQCTNASQCPEDLDCIMNRCQAPLKLNQLCYEDAQCESGRCENNNGICVPLSSNGGPCEQARDCKSGFCDIDTCRAVKDAGQACVSHNECAGFCDYALGECADLLAAGDECTDTPECGNYEEKACINGVCRNLPRDAGQVCTDNYQCESEICNADGECEARGTEGANCSLTQYNACDEGLYCAVLVGQIEGECAPQLGPGEECVLDAQCPNWNCRLVNGRKRCGEQASASEAMCDGLDD